MNRNQAKVKYKLAAVMLLFGSIGIFVRYIPLSSGMMALARGAIGTGFLFLVAITAKKKPSLKAIQKNGLLLLFSGVAIGVNWVCLFEAYRYTTIATATVCYYLAPIFVLLASPFILKEKITLGKVTCILAALFGTILVSGLLGGENVVGTGQDSSLVGVFFGIAAALFYATVIIMNKFLVEISPMDATMAQLGTASLVLLPYVLFTGGGVYTSMDGRGWLLVIILGVVHTGVAYAIYFSCIGQLKSQTVAIFSYLDPAAAIFFAALFLMEKLTFWEIVGALLILGAAFFSEWNKGIWKKNFGF